MSLRRFFNYIACFFAFIFLMMFMNIVRQESFKEKFTLFLQKVVTTKNDCNLNVDSCVELAIQKLSTRPVYFENNHDTDLMMLI